MDHRTGGFGNTEGKIMLKQKIKIILSLVLITVVLLSGCLSQKTVYVSLYVSGGGMVIANSIDTTAPDWQKYADGVYVSKHDLLLNEGECGDFTAKITDYNIENTDNWVRATGHVQITQSNLQCTVERNPDIFIVLYNKDGSFINPAAPIATAKLSVDNTMVSTQAFTLQSDK